MKNRVFHFQLRRLRTATGQRLTVGRLAAAIYVNRPHLCDVLNNTPGHGGNTRWKVAAFLRQQFPAQADELLAALGWDAAGRLKT